MPDSVSKDMIQPLCHVAGPTLVTDYIYAFSVAETPVISHEMVITGA